LSGSPIELPIKVLLASDRPLLHMNSIVLKMEQIDYAAKSSTPMKPAKMIKLWNAHPSAHHITRLGNPISKKSEGASDLVQNVFHVKKGIRESRTSSWQRPSMATTVSFSRLDAEVAIAMATTGSFGSSRIRLRSKGTWHTVPLTCANICV